MGELFSYLDTMLTPHGIRLESEAGLWVAVIALPLVLLGARGVPGEGPTLPVRLSLVAVRVLFVGLVAAAMCLPMHVERTNAPAVAIAVDSSVSVDDAALSATAARLDTLLRDSGGATVDLVSFDADAHPISPGTSASGSLSAALLRDAAAPPGSDPGRALLALLPLLSPDRDRRALLVTDGLENRGDVEEAARRLAADGVELHLLPAGSAGGAEITARLLVAPGDVDLDARVTVKAVLFSTAATEADVVVRWDGRADAAPPATPPPGGVRRTVALLAGHNELSFDLQAKHEGHYRILLEVLASPGDRFSLGNRAFSAVHVRGRPKALLVRDADEEAETHLVRALRGAARHYDVTEVTTADLKADLTTLGGLDRWDLVVLNDPTPGELFDDESAARLASWIGELGGGLLVVGGKHAATMADEKESSFEELLPLEFRRIKRKERIPMAVCFVIDRSASMGREEKLGMALLAIERATEEMTEKAEVAIVVYSDAPRVALPRTPASERSAIRDVLHAMSVGGGTDLYPGLRAAHAELSSSTAKVRHMIVLSDGESISRLHHSRDVVTAIARDGITISTIALSKDSDPAEMKALAELGGGRFYYVENPGEIPSIFTRETQRLTDATVVDKPFRPVVAKHSEIVAGIDFAKGPPLEGFVASRKRATTEVILETETGEPLLARWQYGLGSVTVWTSDARPGWARAWIPWDGYPRLWDALTRATLRRRRPSALRIAGTLVGDGRWRVEVWDDNAAIAGDDARKPPEAWALDGEGNRTRVPLERRGFERWVGSGTLPIPASRILVAERAARVAGARPERAYASMARPYDFEHARSGDNRTALEAMAAAGSGRLLDTAEEAAELLLRPGERFSETREPIWPPLLWWAFGVFLLDIFLRRVGLATERGRS